MDKLGQSTAPDSSVRLFPVPLMLLFDSGTLLHLYFHLRYLFQLAGCICHRNPPANSLKHFNVIVSISKSHYNIKKIIFVSHTVLPSIKLLKISIA